jgi:hypothetical protein
MSTSTKGNFLFSASLDSTINIWSLAKMLLVQTLNRHEASANCVLWCVVVCVDLFHWINSSYLHLWVVGNGYFWLYYIYNYACYTGIKVYCYQDRQTRPLKSTNRTRAGYVQHRIEYRVHNDLL